MNEYTKEEIKKLWFQACLGFNDQQCETKVIERFAELIIDRCVDSFINSQEVKEDTK